MIQVKYTDNSIHVSGHAGYGPKGQDIVCAAVSILVDTLCSYLSGSGHLVRDEFGNGESYLEWRGQPEAVDFAKHGLGLLAREYPRCVSVDRDNDT